MRGKEARWQYQPPGAFQDTIPVKASALTDGYKMDLFLFSLTVAVINIIGVICVFVGLFVTIPVTLMASAYVYRRLSPAEGTEETTEATA